MSVGAHRPVMLRVTSLQRDESGESGTVSLETPGIAGVRGRVPFLSYEETEITGLAGTRTTLLLRPEAVSLVRTGAFLQKMEYRAGEETCSVYATPLGLTELLVRTRSIENSIQDGTGSLRIVYDVELKGFFQHVNELLVEVWEEQGAHGSERGTAAGH